MWLDASCAHISCLSSGNQPFLAVQYEKSSRQWYRKGLRMRVGGRRFHHVLFPILFSFVLAPTRITFNLRWERGWMIIPNPPSVARPPPPRGCTLPPSSPSSSTRHSSPALGPPRCVLLLDFCLGLAQLPVLCRMKRIIGTIFVVVVLGGIAAAPLRRGDLRTCVRWRLTQQIGRMREKSPHTHLRPLKPARTNSNGCTAARR